ncbi:hypothetical protein [Caballeronia temeraria]|uniref:hypothetical protein n=1 Tax=Caballeronia temeraria TaxID=1777137 RepID=UPI0009413CF3|nr:hypothetical protein [Caballeronia temeraria]
MIKLLFLLAIVVIPYPIPSEASIWARNSSPSQYVALTRAQHVLDISDVRDEMLRLFNVPKAARG